MSWEQHLRVLTVGQRMAAILALLLLPLAALSLVSVLVLNDQEVQFRESVEESITTLLPLTTLEHYLQRALVDELEAESNESVPNFAALTENVDKSFAVIETAGRGTDLQLGEIDEAQRAWVAARPSVQRLIEQVRTVHPADDRANEAAARTELQLAIADITQARRQLAGVVKARYVHAVAVRHRQLRWLLAGWVVTLLIAAALVTVFLRSLLGPIKALGAVARSLGEGVAGVRAPAGGNDELSVLAARFNEMASYWEASRQSLLTEATEDPLTGALNRRGILAALETELAAHARQQAPLSLFMIDLDRFKAINDHFGHSAGDRALVWVVSRMRQILREGDRLGRYGGDEFMVVLPHTTPEQARQIAQRMAQVIGEAAAREPARPAISVGVAGAPEHGWGAAALIEAADGLLYEDKTRRRQASGNELARRQSR